MDILRKTKTELEEHIEVMVRKLEEFELKVTEAHSAQSQESKVKFIFEILMFCELQTIVYIPHVLGFNNYSSREIDLKCLKCLCPKFKIFLSKFLMIVKIYSKSIFLVNV